MRENIVPERQSKHIQAEMLSVLHVEPERVRVSCRVSGGALAVQLDELSVYSLQRLAAMLMAAKAATAADSQAVSLGEAAHLKAGALGDMVVSNHCPVPLLLRQVGWSSPVEQLPPSSSRWV